MKIDCELNEREQTALGLLMGLATGAAIFEFRDVEMAKTMVRVMNKLYALSPDFIPYDADNFDPTTQRFPFRRITPQ